MFLVLIFIRFVIMDMYKNLKEELFFLPASVENLRHPTPLLCIFLEQLNNLTFSYFIEAGSKGVHWDVFRNNSIAAVDYKEICDFDLTGMTRE